jgi:hypothetical protein
VPTPEDFPQANRSVPQARKSQPKSVSTYCSLRRFRWNSAVPALVRPDILQLTFRVFKVKPSDATISASIVPGRFGVKTAFKTQVLSLFVSFSYEFGASKRCVAPVFDTV